MILHLMDAARTGCKRALLRTLNINVVVLVIVCVNELTLNEVWIAFGVGKNFYYLPAHDIAAHLGPLKSTCLPMFHSIIGCDTVSSFGGIGKKTAFRLGRHLMRSQKHSIHYHVLLLTLLRVILL